jgi:solute carrier family 35, member F5
LAASAGYGLYTTVLKTKIPDDDAQLMQLVLGYLGLINTVIMLPVLVILIMRGSIDLQNLTYRVFAYLLIGGFLDNAISDYLWARSVILTSPTVATVGLGLTIPLAMISDALMGKEFPTFVEILGANLVLLGFVIVNTDGDETPAVAHSSISDIGNSIGSPEFEMVDSAKSANTNRYDKLNRVEA